MTKFLMLLALPDSYSLFTVMGVAFVSFVLGLLIKLGLLAKSKSRVLKLEDEMLSNHARILKLEKKLAETQSDNTKSSSRFMGDAQEKKIVEFERKTS